MAKIEIVLLTSIVSIVLFLIGFLLKLKSKKEESHNYVFISFVGAALMMITGIMILVEEPILFKTGKNITSLDANRTTEIFTYAAQDSNLNIIFSWALLLLGLSGIIICLLVIYDSRFDEKEDLEIESD